MGGFISTDRCSKIIGFDHTGEADGFTGVEYFANYGPKDLPEIKKPRKLKGESEIVECYDCKTPQEYYKYYWIYPKKIKTSYKVKSGVIKNGIIIPDVEYDLKLVDKFGNRICEKCGCDLPVPLKVQFCGQLQKDFLKSK